MKLPSTFTIGLAAIFLGQSALRADLILEWNLNNGTGSSTNTTGLPLVAGIVGGQMTGGGTTGNTGSPTNTWNRTFGTFTNFADAMANSNYFAWSTTASADYSVSITNLGGFNLRSTGTGPTNAGLFYSTDGVNYSQTGATFTVATNALNSAAATFGSAFATNPLVFSNTQIVYWRLVAYGGTGGRIGIGSSGPSDIQILGTSLSATPPQSLTWVGGDGIWGTGLGGWNNGTNNTNFAANDSATINTANTVTVDALGVSPGSLLVNLSAGTATLTGGPIASPTLTKSGSGTLVLATSNTISSSAITGGAAVIDNARAFGSSAVSIDSATLSMTNAGFTNVANILSLGTNGTVTFDAGAIATLTGAILTPSAGSANQTVNFAKVGAGTLTISNAFGNQMTKNDLSRVGAIALTVDAGTLVFAGNTQKNLGNNTATTNVAWNGNVILSNTTVMSHGAKITGTGNVSIEGGVTLSSRLDFGVTELPLALAINGALTNNNSSGAYTEFTGALSGAGPVTATGSGSARFYSTNSTYTGAVTVSPSGSDGSTQLYSQAFASAASVTVNANTNTNFIAGLSGEIAFRNLTNGSFPAPIGGAGGIEVDAAAAEIQVLLGTNNTYTGKTFLQTGDFVIDTPAGTISTNDIVGNGSTGRLVLGAGSAASVTISNKVVAAQTFVTNTVTSVVTTNTHTAAFSPGAGKTITLAGVVSGGGILKVSGGGDLVVANTGNTYAGGTEIGTGRILFSATSQLGSGKINFGTGANSYLVPQADGMVLPQAVGIGIGFGANIDTAGFNLALSQPVIQSGTGAPLTKWGAGTLTLGGANTYTGNTSIAGGAVHLPVGASLPFVIGASSANNSVGGAGHFLADGAFNIDLAAAGTNAGDSWPLVSTTTKTFGASFSVAGFTESPSGIWSVSTNGVVYEFRESTGILSVSGANPYNDWASGYGLDPATNGAPTSDPDNDGFSNASEYSFGTVPTQGSPALIKITASAGNSIISWMERSDAAVVYVVQERASLSTGSWLNSAAAVTAGSGPTPPAGYVWKQVSVPASGQKFYRVQATY